MSTVASAATKCSLNMAMACSAALTQWLCGKTSYTSIFVGTDIFFDSLGTLVVHHVQCGLVVAHAEDGKYLGEGGDKQGVGAAWHGSHDDGVDVVDVLHKNILHILK